MEACVGMAGHIWNDQQRPGQQTKDVMKLKQDRICT